MYSIKTPVQRVLLVDDDEDDCIIFEQILHELAPSIGLTILNAGEKIVQTVSLEQPDLIFLDINLPRINGIACLRQLQNHESFRSIPVIIYSSLDYTPEIEKAICSGAVQYFQKVDQFVKMKEVLQAILALPGRA